MTDVLSFLKQLITLPGLSGYEGPVRGVIEEAWRPLVDELSVSRLGSLHALRKGRGPEPRPRLLLAAHMDAIGLMATAVEQGFIRFTEVGGVDPRILPGQFVTVHGRRDLPGLVVAPPDRLLPKDQADRPIEMEHLLVDVGLLPDEVSTLVRPGDPISFAQPPLELPGDALAGHTLDNRASVAAVTACLDELQHMTHAWDVWAVATVQEEETLGGGYTSPFEIRPDLAIAIDVTFAKGPGANDHRAFGMGKGPVLGLGPNVHPALFARFKELAEQIDLPYGIEVMPSHSGTDAYAMQVVAEGIPSMVIGIPLRYMHTPVEMVAMKDIRRAGHLLAEFIANLDANFVNHIRWDESE
jgi:endoglucanase